MDAGEYEARNGLEDGLGRGIVARIPNSALERIVEVLEGGVGEVTMRVVDDKRWELLVNGKTMVVLQMVSVATPFHALECLEGGVLCNGRRVDRLGVGRLVLGSMGREFEGVEDKEEVVVREEEVDLEGGRRGVVLERRRRRKGEEEEEGVFRGGGGRGRLPKPLRPRWRKLKKVDPRVRIVAESWLSGPMAVCSFHWRCRPSSPNLSEPIPETLLALVQKLTRRGPRGTRIVREEAVMDLLHPDMEFWTEEESKRLAEYLAFISDNPEKQSLGQFFGGGIITPNQSSSLVPPPPKEFSKEETEEPLLVPRMAKGAISSSSSSRTVLKAKELDRAMARVRGMERPGGPSGGKRAIELAEDRLHRETEQKHQTTEPPQTASISSSKPPTLANLLATAENPILLFWRDHLSLPTKPEHIDTSKDTILATIDPDSILEWLEHENSDPSLRIVQPPPPAPLPFLFNPKHRATLESTHPLAWDPAHLLTKDDARAARSKARSTAASIRCAIAKHRTALWKAKVWVANAKSANAILTPEGTIVRGNNLLNLALQRFQQIASFNTNAARSDLAWAVAHLTASEHFALQLQTLYFKS